MGYCNITLGMYKEDVDDLFNFCTSEKIMKILKTATYKEIDVSVEVAVGDKEENIRKVVIIQIEDELWDVRDCEIMELEYYIAQHNCIFIKIPIEVTKPIQYKQYSLSKKYVDLAETSAISKVIKLKRCVEIDENAKDLT